MHDVNRLRWWGKAEDIFGPVVPSIPLATALLIVITAIYTVAVGIEFGISLLDPFQLDYAEGIVWQQTEMIPGPRMYVNDDSLPFIVFNYPPVYHLIVHAVGGMLDMLMAGRLVSIASTFAVAGLVAQLVLVATPAENDVARRWTRWGVAVAMALLILNLHPVRVFGALFRVDMLAVAFGLAGLLVAAHADGRPIGTTLGLCLCVVSIFTKQTQLPAAAAVFLITAALRPRTAAIAGGIALALAAAVLMVLQVATHNGFLHNIIAYNVNRMALGNLLIVFGPEIRWTLIFALVLTSAACLGWRQFQGPRLLSRMRSSSLHEKAQYMLVLHLFFATIMLFSAFKSGGNINYLLDWLTVGGVLIGVFLCRMRRRVNFFVTVSIIVISFFVQPYRLQYIRPADEVAQLESLVDRIHTARLPVASANMVLIKRAGKQVYFEPAMITELAATGQWDERPLVDMIRSRSFEFIITADDINGPSLHRSPEVDAAMRQAYPCVHLAARRVWIHELCNASRPT